MNVNLGIVVFTHHQKDKTKESGHLKTYRYIKISQLNMFIIRILSLYDTGLENKKMEKVVARKRFKCSTTSSLAEYH